MRRPGAGRKRRAAQDPTLLGDLETLVEPTTRGDPQSPLRWTCKSVRRLAVELQAQGHQVSAQLVSELLRATGFGFQGARKTREGDQHPDRNAQFEHIAARVRDFQKRGKPVISVDAKKKELVGDFKNAGASGTSKARLRRYASMTSSTRVGQGDPVWCLRHSRQRRLGRVGVDHDTPAFAVATIRPWWLRWARHVSAGQGLLITADSGGSNTARARLWKLELQRFADDSGLIVGVKH